MKKNRKGFTLIEIMIAAVIIAVLAVLILPRFMNQTERAIISEAQEQLSAIRRGQKMWQDATGNTGATSEITLCGAGVDCDEAQWSRIGMSPPSGGSFWYDCQDTTCTAVRVGGSHDGSSIAISVPSGFWGCGGNYEQVDHDGPGGTSSIGGCTV